MIQIFIIFAMLRCSEKPDQTTRLRKNVAAVASRRQYCIRGHNFIFLSRENDQCAVRARLGVTIGLP